MLLQISLGIKFVLTPVTLDIYRPDNRKFATPVELEEQIQQKEQQRVMAEQRAQQAEQRAQQAEQLAETERIAKVALQQELERERLRYQELLASLQERSNQQ